MVPNHRSADRAAQEIIIFVHFSEQSFILKNDRILSVTLERQKFNPQASKMSKTQTSLESFFSKGKRASEETEEPTTSKKKKVLPGVSRQVIPTDQARSA